MNIVGYKEDKTVITDGVTNPSSAIIQGCSTAEYEFTTTPTTNYIRIAIVDTNLAENITLTNNGIGNTVVELVEDVSSLKNDLSEQKEIYSETTINVGRKADTTVGQKSVAEGNNTEASGDYSHAEGNSTKATVGCSHSEGYSTEATGGSSHAEGFSTTASGSYSHAEGNSTTASGTSSHAEGEMTEAQGYTSHSEGSSTRAQGETSHSEGTGTIAEGNYSHAEGYHTKALKNQHAQGHWNNASTAAENSDNGTSTGTAFVIGNGTASSASNAFRVTGEGKIYATNSTVNTGADYAEYFEWADGNLNLEDRVGHFVTFDKENPQKIKFANKGDYILGIVSGMPNIIGNGDEDWKHRYILDDFGRYIEESFEYEVEHITFVKKEVIDEETGDTKLIPEKVVTKETKTGTRWKENPDYDPTKKYIPRDQRPEWSAIGMLGVLSVYDDGTCKVNGYCQVSNGGIATSAGPSDYSKFTNPIYRVIERVKDNIIKIVLI